MIDLRSDTVTRPTEEMKRALYESELGDDVFGEDPTVTRLEQLAAEITGKEAALFVASGTMANLVCELTHCGRGDEMILGDQSHIFFYEQGGSAALGGIHPRTVRNQPDGTMAIEELAGAVRGENVHFPRTRLVVIENTHNMCNGTPIGLDYMKALEGFVESRGLRLHIDGARIFNASIALGVPVSELVAPADSVAFCLSKGLAAPAGSLVCGSGDFIYKARRNRKIIGGGMRQAGVLAGPGIVALTKMVDRLNEDHENASRLAAAIADTEGLVIDPSAVLTNIVFFKMEDGQMDAEEFTRRLGEEGVLVLPLGKQMLRAVTHYQIYRQDIDRAVSAIRGVMQSSGGKKA